MSTVAGIQYNNSIISLDYIKCEETFRPYYPLMTDARCVSDEKEPLICVPTLSFVPSRRSILKKDLQRIGSRLQKILKLVLSNEPRQSQSTFGGDYKVWAEPRGIMEKLISRCFPPLIIADLSALTFDMMKDMISTIRRKSKTSGQTSIPVILENHTKDIADFSHIERFSHYISEQDDIEVVTLSELARRFVQGDYQIQRKGTF